MKKIRSWLKMIRLFFCLAYEMTANYFRLTEDLTHNYEICRRICRKIVKSAHIFLDIEGKENIPEEERFLIVSNHRCFFDVVFMMAAMDTPVSFVAAKELWHYPLLHRYLDSIQCISLDRYATELSALKNSVIQMKKAIVSRNVVLFPEGECSYYDTRMKPFKKGGFIGITSMDVNIVPVYLGIDKMHNIGRWMIPEEKVVFKAGECFLPSDVKKDGLKAGELAEYVKEQIENLA